MIEPTKCGGRFENKAASVVILRIYDYLCNVFKKQTFMYKPIEIDRRHLTIMGVAFPDLDTLNSVARAIGSNMYEGFEPTEKLIRLYLDVRTGKVDDARFLVALKAAL
jgi:putative transcriptional regulator